MLRARGVQSCTQIPQALQTFASIWGSGQRGRRSGVQSFPPPSLMALLGQILPQTPHSTQRRALISWRFNFSPDMAKTGQNRVQASQPVQFPPIL